MKYIIDGSNLFRSEGMMAVAACISGFESISVDWIMFFDKSIDLFMSDDLFSNPGKKKAFEALLAGKGDSKEKLIAQLSENARAIFHYLLENYRNNVTIVPGGKKADWFIVSYANMTNGCIVSNDTFTKGGDTLLAEKYPFVRDPTRVFQFCKVQENSFYIEGASIIHPIPTSSAEAIEQLKRASGKRSAPLTDSLPEDEGLKEMLRAYREARSAASKSMAEKKNQDKICSWINDVPQISGWDIVKAFFS